MMKRPILRRFCEKRQLPDLVEALAAASACTTLALHRLLSKISR